MSVLEFPGATFVGVHDDERDTGLATEVRGSIPEDSILVELDTGGNQLRWQQASCVAKCFEISVSHLTYPLFVGPSDTRR